MHREADRRRAPSRAAPTASGASAACGSRSSRRRPVAVADDDVSTSDDTPSVWTARCRRTARRQKPKHAPGHRAASSPTDATTSGDRSASPPNSGICETTSSCMSTAERPSEARDERGRDVGHGVAHGCRRRLASAPGRCRARRRSASGATWTCWSSVAGARRRASRCRSGCPAGTARRGCDSSTVPEVTIVSPGWTRSLRDGELEQQVGRVRRPSAARRRARRSRRHCARRRSRVVGDQRHHGDAGAGAGDLADQARAPARSPAWSTRTPSPRARVDRDRACTRRSASWPMTRAVTGGRRRSPACRVER